MTILLIVESRYAVWRCILNLLSQVGDLSTVSVLALAYHINSRIWSPLIGCWLKIFASSRT